MKLGEAIQAARKSKGFTQTEVAEKIGKNLRTYQKYESDEIAVPLSVLQQIAEIFEARVYDFLKLTDTPSSFSMMFEWLRSTGYDVVVIEEEEWRVVQLKDLKTWERYRITDSDLRDLEKTLLSYTKFQVSELIERSKTRQ